MANLNRRTFLQGVGASSAAAAAVGCNGIENIIEPRVPLENVLPYTVQPDQITPGLATLFATRCGGCSASCGVVAKVREGRVVKLEGNPDHPLSRGKLCAVGLQEILGTYSPDRFDGPRKGNGAISWDDGIKEAAAAVSKARAGGKQVVWLGHPRSASQGALVRQFVQAAGGRVVYWSPLEHDALRAATQAVFGVFGEPRYLLEAAHTVVSFGADFMNGWGDLRMQRGWAEGRDPKVGGFVARTVAVEARLSNSSIVADLHLRAKPGTEASVAMALASLVAAKRGYSGPASSLLAGIDPASIATAADIALARLEEVAGWMAAAPSLALPGGLTTSLGATALATATLVLNEVAGAIGSTVVFNGARNTEDLGSYADVIQVIEDAKAGRIGALFIDDLDPAYLLPPDTGAAEALAKVDQLIAFVNEPTDSLVDGALVLPPGTVLENWGDAESFRGIYTLQQPTMRVRHDVRGVGDVLLAIAAGAGLVPPAAAADATAADAADAPAAAEAPPAAAIDGEVEAPMALNLPDLRATSYKDYVAAWWKARVWTLAGRPGTFQGFWTDALQSGGYFTEIGEAGATFSLGQAPDTAAKTPAGDLVVTAFVHPFILDGRHANKPWAQEVPEPISSYTWGTWAEINPETAARLGLKDGETAKITTAAGSIEVGWMPAPTIRPDTIAVVLGNGHKGSGRYAGFGVNPMQLFNSGADSAGAMTLGIGGSVAATGNKSPLHRYIGTITMEGRGVNYAVSVDDLGKGDGPASIVPAHHVPVDARLTDAGLNDMYPEPDHPTYRFAMAVDNNRCTGCGACETACFAENNIPFVGPEQIRIGRHMGWIRLSRYFEGTAEEPDVRFQMNVCQQCSHAPCEGVCPVLATYHNLDGLNAMVYNRCVGTRYCGNNCPYTARRFNYHTFRWPESYNLMLSPDISTREMGVMEKCTFCVHRIRDAKDAWRDRGMTVPDSALTKLTACAQACPSDAITFGNAKDPDGSVSKLWQEPRAYAMLEELNTKPGVRYLARVSHSPSKLHGHGGHGAASGGADHGAAPNHEGGSEAQHGSDGAHH